MNISILNPETCYAKHELKASQYFAILSAQVRNKTYIPRLTNDLQTWQQSHLSLSLLSLFSRTRKHAAPKEYHSYLKWLDRAGKLESYLDRSISYIFMRDLGKSLTSSETNKQVERVVLRLMNQLRNRKDQNETPSFTMATMYNWAQKEHIEMTVIWLFEKLKAVVDHIPAEMDATSAHRKLLKIIAGVVMHVLEELDDGIPLEERSQKLEEAIRLGYAYGLTYPFIDDLLDAKVLTPSEELHYSNIIRTTLTTGMVPVLGNWPDKNRTLLRFIHRELSEAFTYIKTQQKQETTQSFFEQAYVFFQSQEVDRNKDLKNMTYTNEELYIPVILKSSSSRLIVRSVIGAGNNHEVDQRMFYYGIYNQLADDFTDLFDDLASGAVTPYTYYYKHHHDRPDLINPYELYWAVIGYIIHEVYEADVKTAEIILTRAINGLKRYKKRVGDKKYNEIMDIFAGGQNEFNQIVQKLVQKADDVDFFDKLLRDEMVSNIKNDEFEREHFSNTIEQVRHKVNSLLNIPLTGSEPIVEAANYSLAGEGKRLRPIVTWVMGVNEYGLSEQAIAPLLKSLEYLHTASLIFDDLPAQDNSPIRRGRPTLHQVYNVAVAEITGLFLTQKAIEEQAALKEFEPKAVLELIQYSTQMTELMCQGQAMDLASKGKVLTVEELNQMCFYKTGLGFEAALIMPAILARRDEQERSALKLFAKHAGIAFQIKDDLLDVEGHQEMLGKPVGNDADNTSSTFVSILGAEGARKAMWDHYCLALEALNQFPKKIPFLNHLLTYFIHRNK